MFKLATKPTYKRIISVNVPLDMGKSEKQTFNMEFRRLSVTETKELVEEAQSAGVSDEDMIKRYAVGWDGIKDEDGNDLDFTAKNLEELMDIPYVRKAIMQAFVEDVFGKESVRKN